MMMDSWLKPAEATAHDFPSPSCPSNASLDVRSGQPDHQSSSRCSAAVLGTTVSRPLDTSRGWKNADRLAASLSNLETVHAFWCDRHRSNPQFAGSKVARISSSAATKSPRFANRVDRRALAVGVVHTNRTSKRIHPVDHKVAPANSLVADLLQRFRTAANPPVLS